MVSIMVVGAPVCEDCLLKLKHKRSLHLSWLSDPAEGCLNHVTISTTLRADNTPILRSYRRSPALPGTCVRGRCAPGASVDVQGLSGSVTSATLRIYANSPSSTGYTPY